MKSNYVTGVYLHVNSDRTRITRIDIVRENGLHTYKPESKMLQKLLERFFIDNHDWMFKRFAHNVSRLSSMKYDVVYLPDWINNDDKAIAYCQQSGLTGTRLYRSLIAFGPGY